MLAEPSTMAAATPYPADDDKAGWRDHVEAVNAQLIGAMQPMMAGLPVEISDDRIGGVPVFRARPTGGADEGRRVFSSDGWRVGKERVSTCKSGWWPYQ